MKPPRLPPLVNTKACFAFCIEGSTVSAVRELSSDDLKPWTTTDPVEGEPMIKPNVRKHAVARIDGHFEPCKGDGRSSEFHLTEYSAWLPRQTGQIVGNVLILYDFTMPGDLPTIMNMAHGNDALRDIQQMDLGSEFPVADADNPFIDGVVPGVRGEKFLKVHPSKIGWVVFIQRNNRMVLGIVCFMYEYIREGPLPEVLRDNSITVPGPPLSNRHGTSFSSNMEKSSMSDLHGGTVDDFVDVEEIVEATDENDMSMSSTQADAEKELKFESVRNLVDYSSRKCTKIASMAAGTATSMRIFSLRKKIVIRENHDILNNTKPQHPPLVRNARAYAFFVASNVVYPHDINRDDFSPWSGNGTAENPTCYRTKVRKFPVETDDVTGLFRVGHGDYRLSPYHLVHLYSIHPKETRLRKKVGVSASMAILIAYLMETQTRTIISHVMIMYDYHTEGPVPRIRGPYSKRFMRAKPRRPIMDMGDTLDDVSDISESEKESPFNMGPQQGEDGSIFLDLTDMEFLNDRNRQLHYLINKPRLVENLSCLNTRVPMFPPMITTRGTFVYFIDGGEVDVRNLTCDALAPWSESLQMSDEGQLRVMKMSRSQGTDYSMHIYAATLPRLPRLKKRVIYLTKSGMQIGHSMIVYWYTEDGALPSQVPHGNCITSEALYTRLPPSIRDEARRLLANHPPAEVAEMLSNKTNFSVPPRVLYNIRRELRRDNPRYVESVKMEGSGIDDLDYIPDWLQADIVHAKKQGELAGDQSSQGIVDAGAIDVSHTEEVAQAVGSASQKSQNSTNPFLNIPPGSGHTLREDAVWRYARVAFGVNNNDAIFDALWRMLLEKNESRLLQNIKSDFGIEIVADHQPIIVEGVEGDSIEAMVVTEDGLVPAEIVDEGMIPDGATIENVEIVEERVVMDEHPQPEAAQQHEQQQSPAPLYPDDKTQLYPDDKAQLYHDDKVQQQQQPSSKESSDNIHIGEEVDIQSVETVETER
ncbi:unnamed protein product [Nippostrongylus brasiliensis]|uniref:DUF1618 domain-containing protein n=1 Tax=Nippostrongylus brasiliensis TaxID=27835 RepID=A0A0N4YKB5_NIPBR|nr:unnamed protein product [Nippostrongylus brasiliensis]